MTEETLPCSIEDRGHGTPCWVWAGALNSHGYGVAWRGGKTQLAHRISYSLRHPGNYQPWEDIDHLCRVRACVNPDHLEKVTYLKNIRRRKSNKLDMGKAREIRRLYAEGVGEKELAARYGISRTQAREVAQNRSWIEGSEERIRASGIERGAEPDAVVRVRDSDHERSEG